MVGPIVKLATNTALKMLKDHGHKAKVVGDKIKASYKEVKSGIEPIKERTFTKIQELEASPTVKSVKDFLGYKKGGLVCKGNGKAIRTKKTKIY